MYRDKRTASSPQATRKTGTTEPAASHPVDVRAVRPGMGGLTLGEALYLQRTIGNAAVRRWLDGAAPVARTGGPSALVQREAWENRAAKFQTKNNEGAANSEYDVKAPSGYRRYAPINMQRGDYTQALFESDKRLFSYIDVGSKSIEDDEFTALWVLPDVTRVDGTQVTFKSHTEADAPEVVADIVPSEGAWVFDCEEVRGDGAVIDRHIGHELVELGKPLPTLDDELKLADVKARLAAEAGSNKKEAKKGKGKQGGKGRCIVC